MKLVVMIPTKNESTTIGDVISEIPKHIEGIDEVEVIVIDGASSDGTVEVALKAGAALVVRDHINRGLAQAHKIGLIAALDRGADIIVSTDADMQYDQSEIPRLIAPILNGEADMVLGSRFAGWIEEMPLKKRIGNKIATLVTSLLAGQRISDAQSGFRAMQREVAADLIVDSKRTYVQETLIRSIRRGFRVVEVPIKFRKRKDESRLIKSVWGYAFSVFPDLLLTFAQVAPLRLFGGLALLLLAICLPILSGGIIQILVAPTASVVFLVLAVLTLLVPSMITLLGVGVVMDHIAKVRLYAHNRDLLDTKKLYTP
ncbi:MAG: glycosyltransferase family 2 protein [Candidatus Thorarchaeota archaeon]